MLLNRQAERAALSRLLDAARAGRSAVLVVCGAPGIGKTALIENAIESALDERVQDRIVAETGGNPLALLELPRTLTFAELAGGFGVLDAQRLPGRIAESFRRRLEVLPADTRLLLLVAAAEPVGEPVLMWRAAHQLGIGAQAAAAAEAAGLLTIGERVTFRHPLVRSAVYRAASPPERRAAHQALAEATDAGADPDRRAWHRAQATLEPDEMVAAELDRQACRAQARGGVAAAAAFFERSAELTPEPVHAPDLLLDGLAVLVTQGFTAGAPLLKRAVAAFRGADVPAKEQVRWLWLACHAAGLVWDYDSWDVLSARLVEASVELGALATLPIAYSTRAGVHMFAGDFGVSASCATEAESVREAMTSSVAPYGALVVAAFQGREAEAAVLIEAGTKDAESRGRGDGLSLVQWATAPLCNGLGRYEQALTAARYACEDSHVQWYVNWSIAEFIEAATRAGVAEPTADALDRLPEMSRASGTDWALGIEARSRALLTEGENAEVFYREAIDRLGRAHLPVELARAQLLYGEWLRRRRRRRDARQQLHSAFDLFESIGAEAFAKRAKIELRATGGQAREHTVEVADTLTAQEAMVARLAGQGSSNPEIAAQLFISRATVAYHLRKVFVKLGVTSRDQLTGVLPVRPGAAASLAPVAPHG